MSYVEITEASLTKAAEAAGSKLHHYKCMSEDNKLGVSIEAHARTLDAFEAFRRGVSDAIFEYFQNEEDALRHNHLCSFIIPKPVDPLVVEAREICARVCEGWTDIPRDRAAQYREGAHDDEDDFAYALAALKRGGRIVFDEEKAGE